MLPCVLLNGELDEGKLKGALNEIKHLVKADAFITIVVESHGGDTTPTLDFINKVNAAIPLHRLALKIYRASSAAGLIATSLGGYREIAQKGEISLHMPVISKISSAEVDHSGKLSTDILDTIRRADALLMNIADRYHIRDDQQKMGTLLGGDILRFKAEECVKLGIADAIF
jgi:hypothetical protein